MIVIGTDYLVADCVHALAEKWMQSSGSALPLSSLDVGRWKRIFINFVVAILVEPPLLLSSHHSRTTMVGILDIAIVLEIYNQCYFRAWTT